MKPVVLWQGVTIPNPAPKSPVLQQIWKSGDYIPKGSLRQEELNGISLISKNIITFLIKSI